MNTKLSRLVLPFLLLMLIDCAAPEPPAKHSPESTLADLVVDEGLEITLFAHEPMLTNPTNIDIDVRGRVWVCEAYNYRSDLNPGNPTKSEGDRILILEDTNGDGKADKQIVFYQGPEINAALGICVLGSKIIVSCSPNVYVFTDEDGDDVPEKKEILFTGIQGEQHDHGVHSFTFGHDGRVYFTMGDQGKNLLSANGDTLVDIHGNRIVTDGKPYRMGMVLRMDPDGSNLEVVAHNFRNNYEATVDPFGTIWQSDNDDDGNKGTRINYVMEFGNFGYRDEMTGAGWRSRRTNMEKEIPLRHWHLNDPGVVPNLLQTGSGSPCGITMNEGTLLPKKFYGQIIHAEPGHNVVRAYPVEKDGAGYKASIVNIVKSKEDQWFRPSDVAIAPDGSLFIADWYDPGVGGHQVGDQNRGRIYRVAPPKSRYKIKPPDTKNLQQAATALLSPNSATRYLAWTTLSAAGNAAEEPLKKLWESPNKRHRAQALWLLSRLKDSGDSYIDEAINDDNDDLRIAGLRITRALKRDVIPVAGQLVNDPSPSVRREVAIALKGNSSQKAADLWTSLALQHDGKDRWYLEALGIGAAGNDELYFNTWKEKTENGIGTEAGRDIIWRSRSSQVLPLLADLIIASDDQQMLRYFRAFDFHNHPDKQKILTGLALNTNGEKAMYAMKHLNPSKVQMTPSFVRKLNEVLNDYKNRTEYVEIVNAFNLRTKTPDLLKLGLLYPDSIAGKEAIMTLARWNRYDMFEKIMRSGSLNEQTAFVKTAQPLMYDSRMIAILENVMLDSTRAISLRRSALRAFGGHGESERRLLAMAKENSIPDEMLDAARGVFQSIWRKDMREEAAQYIKLPSTGDGAALPDISVLETKSGNAQNGKLVFNTICSTCHQLNGEGVDFGPGLSEIGDKLSRQAMYKAILYPDQGISFGYEGYLLKMKDGTEAFGMIASESESEVEIKYMTSKQILNKADIVSRMQMDNSLMPSNLQAGISEQELVDLVEYLMTLKKVGL